MASAQSPAFEALRLVNDGRRMVVLDQSGQRLSAYPHRIDFRVTVSRLAEYDLGYEPFPISSDIDTETYLRTLSFRAKVFRGLAFRLLEPAAVQMIGVPADVPYDERTYRVSFELNDVSIDDRFVFEVLAPDGQRIARFHLPLN
jgi:hypothetical protein